MRGDGGKFPLAPPLASTQVIPSDTTQNIVMMAKTHIKSATRIASVHGIDGGTTFALRGVSSCSVGGSYRLSIGLSCLTECCEPFGWRDVTFTIKTHHMLTRGHPSVCRLVRSPQSKPPLLSKCSQQHRSCRHARCLNDRGAGEANQSKSVRDHPIEVLYIFGWRIPFAMPGHTEDGRLQRWIRLSPCANGR